MEQKKGIMKLAAPFVIASLWIGFYIGPGFASGAMLTRYLVGPSWLGIFVGPAIVCLYASTLAYLIFEYSRRKQSNDYREVYDGVFGKYKHIFSNIKDISILITIFVVSVMSFATAGRLIRDLTGIPATIGGLALLAFSFVMVIKGQLVIVKMNTLFTWMMIAVVIAVLIVGVGPSWPAMSEYVGNRTFNQPGIRVFINFILFTNVITSFIDTSIPVLKGVVKTKQDVKRGVILGFLLTFTITSLMNVILAAAMPQIIEEDIPTLWALNNVIETPIIRIVYLIVAILAVFTSMAGLHFGTVERYQRTLGKVWKNSSYNQRRIAILLFVFPFAIYFGQKSIPGFIMYGFDLLGYINKPLLELPIFFILPWVLLRMTKRGETGPTEGTNLPDGAKSSKGKGK